MPTLKADDEYEEMAAALQCAIIQTLDQVLREHGHDIPSRRKLCEAFAHRSGVLLDQAWVESEVGRVFPIVGFSRVHPDYEPDEIIINSGMFSFAEYAGGDVSWYFDEHDPDGSPQRVGTVGEDGQASD